MRDTKRPLFTVTIKDCDVQTFRAGGKGGQHQNKTETGVRIIHHASGAVGECRETKSQRHNKETAFKRMANTEAFKAWHRLEVSRVLGVELIEEKSGSGRNAYGARYVRTYDFLDRHVKDPETGHTRFDVEKVMNGDIDSFILARLHRTSAVSGDTNHTLIASSLFDN